MKIIILLILITLPVLAFSQKLKRNVFDYEKLKSENFAECDENLKKELESSAIAIEENNSKKAVMIAKKIYGNNIECYEVYQVYGYSLFRSGEWFEGIEIIEKGIQKFGSVPDLIKLKYEMSLEMAELGTGQKNIDGNSVFKANSLKYDEEQFKTENLKSALLDLEYLLKTYNRTEEIYYAAKVYQYLKNYNQSTEYFKSLLNDIEYKKTATFNIADNYINTNKYTEAETELHKLLAETPKEGQIFDKLAEVYELKNEKSKAKEFKNKAIYYKNIPAFLNLEFSNDNFELLKFFGSNENKTDKKLIKLDEISKQNNQDYTIDVCLMILKLHTNHGNGVEEKATEILAKIGKPAIEKVNKLFQTNVSTCTITNLSDIMATVKDEKSWELMKTYLSNIAYMPSTLIPPAIPENMILFDEDRGIREILTVVKNLLNQVKKIDDPMGDLNRIGQYVFYYPLEKINNIKLRKIAIELNYTEAEFKLLEEKIK